MRNRQIKETKEDFFYLLAVQEIANSAIKAALNVSPGLYDDILATYGYLVEGILTLPASNDPIDQIDLMIIFLQKIKTNLENKTYQ